MRLRRAVSSGAMIRSRMLITPASLPAPSVTKTLEGALRDPARDLSLVTTWATVRSPLKAVKSVFIARPALSSGNVSTSSTCWRSSADIEFRNALRFASGSVRSTDAQTSPPPRSSSGTILPGSPARTSRDAKAGSRWAMTVVSSFGESDSSTVIDWFSSRTSMWCAARTGSSCTKRRIRGRNCSWLGSSWVIVSTSSDSS